MPNQPAGARARRSDLRLKRATDHVTYELKMMSRSVELLVEHIARRDDDTVRLVLEAFLIHCRNLLDFLYPPPSAQADDMLAEDLFADPLVWSRARPALPADVRAARTAVNKLVAHLSYQRRAYALPRWKWRVSLLHNHIIRCATRLAKKLPPGRRAWITVPRGPIFIDFNVE
jgi:hypothetical protein